eukprot:TRINITY_DN5476_c0_g2_i10.p1 TRINITY_DN5476_c0_g2~~TRINITY_DN5476_c0_g2_i10.p1  ORF type:complete len:369 (-),score=113.98 TRINITY_DN5476_c0_g2_i10:578-1684(-)
MAAFEAMHPKMDVRKNARLAMTPKRALKEGIIKPAKDLTLADTLGIMDELLCKFVQWMHGGAVAQTVYSCLYILDTCLYSDNAVLQGYFTAVLYLLYETQSLFRNCRCLKDEDFTCSHIMEQLVKDTPQQVEERLAAAEKFAKEAEGSKEAKEGVAARVRVMKGIVAAFTKLIGEFKGEEVMKVIEFAEKQLPVVLSTIPLASPETSKCIDESVLLSFPISFQSKKIPVYAKPEAYSEIARFFKHCKTLIGLSTTKELQDIWLILERFMHDKPTVFARTLYSQSIFPKGEFLYFGKESLLDLNVIAVVHYSKSAKNFKTSPVFKDFMEKLSMMTKESIYTHLKVLARYRNEQIYFFNDLGLLLNFAVA